MPSVNNPSQTNNPDLTSAAFNSFYTPPSYPVDAGTYDAAVAYFISNGNGPTSAKRLADTVFRISASLNIPAMQLLNEIQNRSDIDINQQLSYYLNQINSPTTLQGTTTPIQSNFYAQRAILD
jgi:hypothetical protein